MFLRWKEIPQNRRQVGACTSLHARLDVAYTRARKTKMRLSNGPAAQSGGQKGFRRARITQVGNLPGFYRHPPVSCAIADLGATQQVASECTGQALRFSFQFYRDRSTDDHLTTSLCERPRWRGPYGADFCGSSLCSWTPDAPTE